MKYHTIQNSTRKNFRNGLSKKTDYMLISYSKKEIALPHSLREGQERYFPKCQLSLKLDHLNSVGLTIKRWSLAADQFQKLYKRSKEKKN